MAADNANHEERWTQWHGCWYKTELPPNK